MAITISVTSGTGYFGSTYTQVGGVGPGQWYADSTPIPGATGNTYVLDSRYEGKGITYRTASEKSNILKLFMPSQIPGLVAQFDASRSDLITLISGGVSSWGSRVGSWTATQATGGNRPGWSATGRNGKPAVIGDGVSQYLDIVDSGNLPTAVPAHLFAVAYSAGASANYRMLIKWGSVNTARRGIAKSNANKVTMFGGLATTNIQSSEEWPATDKIVSAAFLDPGASLIINGDVVTDSVNPFNAPDNGAKYIFRDASLYWNGSAQDLPIYNRLLTTAQRQKVEGYLASKWGLRALLPSGHPYKSINPLPEGYVGNGVLGALVGVGVLGTPIPIEINATLGALTAVSTLTPRRNVVIEGELGGLTATSTLTSIKAFKVSGILGGLVGDSTLMMETNIIGEAVLGALTAEAVLATEEKMVVEAILGGLVAEGEMIVPSPFSAEIIFGGLVGVGVLEQYPPGVIDITLGGLIGEATLVDLGIPATPTFFGEGILGELVAESRMADSFVSQLIVEDGTIVPDANSYVTRSYVDNYMMIGGYTDWAEALPADREAAIARATLGIDYVYGDRFPGSKVSPRVQSLKWPRKEAEDARGYEIGEEEIPTEIMKAVAEAAYLEWVQPGYLMPNWTPDQLVISETLGPLSVTYSDPAAFGMGGNLPTLSKIDGILATLLGAKVNQMFGTTERV